MPNRARRSCSTPGCPNFLPCPEHSWRTVYDFNRGTRKERGYDQYWQQARRYILARDPLCKICRRAESTQVDHIIPMARGGARLDPANLQGLCAACHSRKTATEDSNFAMKGSGR